MGRRVSLYSWACGEYGRERCVWMWIIRLSGQQKGESMTDKMIAEENIDIEKQQNYGL
jgi:hypothetical protein